MARGHRRRKSRWLLAAGVSTLLCCLARPSRADSVVWLTWEPPPECPAATFIVQRVEEWLGGPIPGSTDLNVDTRLAWAEEQWEITVVVNHEGATGQRHVAVASCQEAAEFVAVAVVLAMDPSRVEIAPDAANEEANSSDFTPPAASLESTSSMPSGPLNSPEEPQPSQPNRASARSSARGFVGLSGSGVWGPVPTIQPGMGLVTGVKFGSWQVEFEADWLPPIGHRFERARVPIAFSLLSGRGMASYLFGDRSASFGPSLALSGGAIVTRQRSDEDNARFEPWLAVGGGGIGSIRLSSLVDLWAQAELQVPLLRPLFVLDDGTKVHQVSIGGRVALGIRVFFSPE